MSDTLRQVIVIDIGGPAIAFPLAVGKVESGTRFAVDTDMTFPEMAAFFALS